jgi:hypothetical protein
LNTRSSQTGFPRPVTRKPVARRPSTNVISINGGHGGARRHTLQEGTRTARSPKSLRHVQLVGARPRPPELPSPESECDKLIEWRRLFAPWPRLTQRILDFAPASRSTGSFLARLRCCLRPRHLRWTRYLPHAADQSWSLENAVECPNAGLLVLPFRRAIRATTFA